MTINIHNSIHEEGKKWITEKYIPEMLNLDKFNKARIVRVLSEVNNDSYTYSIQFEAKSKNDIELFYKEHSSYFERDSKLKFGEMMLFFSTELELLGEFEQTNI